MRLPACEYPAHHCCGSQQIRNTFNHLYRALDGRIDIHNLDQSIFTGGLIVESKFPHAASKVEQLTVRLNQKYSPTFASLTLSGTLTITGCLKSQLCWDTGLGSITHLLGPTDETFILSAGTGQGLSIETPSGGSITYKVGGTNRWEMTTTVFRPITDGVPSIGTETRRVNNVNLKTLVYGDGSDNDLELVREDDTNFGVQLKTQTTSNARERHVAENLWDVQAAGDPAVSHTGDTVLTLKHSHTCYVEDIVSVGTTIRFAGSAIIDKAGGGGGSIRIDFDDIGTLLNPSIPSGNFKSINVHGEIQFVSSVGSDGGARWWIIAIDSDGTISANSGVETDGIDSDTDLDLDWYLRVANSGDTITMYGTNFEVIRGGG